MLEIRKRVLLKSPVREIRTPGSVRGVPGNRCFYRDKTLVRQSVRLSIGTKSLGTKSSRAPRARLRLAIGDCGPNNLDIIC